jgi:hypothetical protein
MNADIANEEPDSIYNQGLLKYEPWQIALASLVNGAAVMGVLLAFLNLGEAGDTGGFSGWVSGAGATRRHCDHDPGIAGEMTRKARERELRRNSCVMISL